MSNVIAMPTMMHTGTRFMLRNLTNVAYSSEDSLDQDLKTRIPSMNTFIHMHMIEEVSDVVVRIAKNHKTLIPLRDPARICESWKRREGKKYWANRDNMIYQWDILINKIDKHDPVYFLIDSPNRELWLDRAISILGFDFDRNWDEISPFKTASVKVTEEMEEAVPYFVRQFYKDKVYPIEESFDDYL